MGRVGEIRTKAAAWIRQLGLIASANHFVLTIGDEGATVIQFRGRRVVDASFVAADAEDGEEVLRDMFRADKQAAILVSADVLEQMYREEVMPRVGRMDRGTVIRRRLELAFPNDSLRAAVPLEGEKKNSDSVMLTSLPATAVVERWVSFLETVDNPVHGFCLLPLESVSLAPKLAPPVEGEERRVWRALVTQQATSGFRQIFESDGNLVVTRLTQRPPGELTIDGVALLIERELRSSISYIKRLGYTDLDRLDLIVVGEAGLAELLEERSLPVASVTVLTPHEACARLGLEQVGPGDGAYADLLHAEYLASHRRPRVTLPTEAWSRRLAHMAAFKGGFVAAVALSCLALFYCGTIAADYFDAGGSIDLLEQQAATERQSIELARRRLQNAEYPIDDLILVERTEAELERLQVNPTGLLRGIAGALGPSERVQKISFLTPGAVAGRPGAVAPAPPPRGAAAKPEPLYEMRLTVRFYGTAGGQTDSVLALAKDVRERLAKALPGHEIGIERMPQTLGTSKVVEGSTTARVGPAEPPSAEYLIRKGA